jgi:hypothetical protein
MFCRVEIKVYDEGEGLYEVAVYINGQFFESKIMDEDELAAYGLQDEERI